MFASVAQWLERSPCKRKVVSSTLIGGFFLVFLIDLKINEEYLSLIILFHG